MISPLLNILEADVWGKYTKDMEQLRKWRFYGIFVDFLKNLRRDALFQSPIHGEGHVERTMLHGAFAAMDNNLDEHDTRLLLTMCAYHDTGRLSDWLDDAHGLSSTFKLEGLTDFQGEDLEMMKAGIEAHSRADKDMDSIIKAYDVENFEKTKELAKFLKDSDGLDRVRISDLDTKFLRNKSAALRAEMSKYIFEVYTKEQERLGIETGKKLDYFHMELVTAVRDNVGEMLSDGKCAFEIVLSELGRLMKTDVTDIECENSCNNSLSDCGCYLGAYAFLKKYLQNDVCRIEEFKRAYEKQYKSVKCGTLRPAGIRKDDPVHICAALILDSILFTYRFLTAEK